MKSIENPVILGIIKKTHPFFEQPVFHGKYLRVLLRSSYGCFGKHTTGWLVSAAAQDAELLRASQRSKADGSTAICGNLPKTNAERIRRRGHWMGPILGGDHPQYRFMYFSNFQRFPLLNLHCLGWCPMMTPFFWALGCQEYIRSGGSIAGQIRQIPLDFFLRNIQTWNLQHPFLNRCFNWMTPNCYMKNVCFTISIHFKIVVLGTRNWWSWSF